MANTEADVFMVKYIEITGTDPVKVAAACASLGIKASEAGIDTTTEETPPKKRGPGRPKKEDTAEEAPPKRRRGRPPKKKDEDAEEPKRKRGRPPTQAEDAPKRRRGRPRKQKEEPEEASSKRRSAEPPDSDGDDQAPTYVDIVKHLKVEDPRRLANIVEELYLEFGWDKPRDLAQVLISVRKDTKLEETDFWAVLERICPAGDEDDWLDLLEDKITPHLEDAIGAAEED
jgi:hypothetical protein